MPNPTVQNDAMNTQQDNLEAANIQAAKIEIEKKAKDAAQAKGTVTGIFDVLNEANLDSPEKKESVRKIADSFSDDKVTHLFTTMMMFLKSNVLTEQSFGWLKAAMSFIEVIANITSALFGKGLLNAFNLDKIMDFPFLKSLNSLFGIIDDKGDNLDQSGLDQAMNTARVVGEQVEGFINGDNISQSATESVLRATTKPFDSDRILNAVAESDMGKAAAKKFTKVRDCRFLN